MRKAKIIMYSLLGAALFVFAFALLNTFLHFTSPARMKNIQRYAANREKITKIVVLSGEDGAGLSKSEAVVTDKEELAAFCSAVEQASFAKRGGPEKGGAFGYFFMIYYGTDSFNVNFSIPGGRLLQSVYGSRPLSPYFFAESCDGLTAWAEKQLR